MELMKHYAEFIVKLQDELGIHVTHFYTDGLVQNQITSSLQGEEQPESDFESENKEDIDPDAFEYELPLTAALANQTAPPPREEIFTEYVDRKKKSCPSNNTNGSEEQTEATKVIRRSILFQKSCSTSYDRWDKPNLTINIESGVYVPDRSEPYFHTGTNLRGARKTPFWQSSDFGQTGDNYTGDNTAGSPSSGKKQGLSGAKQSVAMRGGRKSNVIQRRNNSCAWQPSNSDRNLADAEVSSFDPNLYSPNQSDAENESPKEWREEDQYAEQPSDISWPVSDPFNDDTETAYQNESKRKKIKKNRKNKGCYYVSPE
jgi:hypothetical protein